MDPQAISAAQLADPSALPQARLRDRLEDFVVEELPAYAPSGAGEHAFITFEKRGLNTHAAVREIAEALGVDARAAGVAGMKDRHAITTQTVSFAFPLARDLGEALADFEHANITIQHATRHGNKLKTGHLLGNRFSITLRELEPARQATTEGRLAAAKAHGVPNIFGRQRFGRFGDNADVALAWLRGERKPPRDRRKQKLLFSALQSELFNRVMTARIAHDSWHTVLGGDIAKKHDNGALFDVDAEAEQVALAQERAARGEICGTGPMFGVKMRQPLGQPAEIEREVLETSGIDEALLERAKRAGAGTRRGFVLRATEVSWSLEADVARLFFVLPKGGYATTWLGHVWELTDAQSASPARH